MASLRDIKRRIKSVQNTQKITQAMRMVAVAKVKRAENKVKASRPFALEIVKAFRNLLAANPQVSDLPVKPENAIDNYPELLKQRDLKTVGLLIVTSDRGLAGAYNANVIRKAIARIRELKKMNIGVKLFIVGVKGINALKRANLDIVKTYTRMPAVPTAGEANVIAEELAESFVSADIDRIEVITTSFKSMISFEVQNWQVLPVMIAAESDDVKSGGPVSEMLFEPNPESVLQKMVPLYISNRIFQALIEASASELSARMNAMAAATKNAGEMIQHLSLIYNKARQFSITQEILEVVGGAEALKS